MKNWSINFRFVEVFNQFQSFFPHFNGLSLVNINKNHRRELIFDALEINKKEKLENSATIERNRNSSAAFVRAH